MARHTIEKLAQNGAGRALGATLLVLLCISLNAEDPIQLPNGLAITPKAAPGSILMPLNPGIAGRPNTALGQAVTTSLSPDAKTLLVLTSGYNREGQGKEAKLNEYVFVYDASTQPLRQIQALPIPNSFCGLAWN